MEKQLLEKELINAYLVADKVRGSETDFKEITQHFNNIYDKLIEIDTNQTPARVADLIAEAQNISYGKVYFLVFKMRLESETHPFQNDLFSVDIRKAGTFKKPVSLKDLMPDDMIIIDPSGKVEADVDVYFGVAFVVTNLTKNPLTIEYRLDYPPMTNPETGKTDNGSFQKITFNSGATEKGHYYYFLDEWEMVEGTWEFSYTAPNGMKALKKFDIKRK